MTPILLRDRWDPDHECGLRSGLLYVLNIGIARLKDYREISGRLPVD
ncbi:MAG: hypothetical protein KAV87_00445 [Desulfobacteraceae bacterium]|nr:hypothetical protein [Desulfobacteraceae bacterium]